MNASLLSKNLTWCFAYTALFVLIVLRMATLTNIAPSGASTSILGFSGEYSDPNHPYCKRSVEATTGQTDANAIVSGTDGNPGCPPDGSGEAWTVNASIVGETIVVDFSPKGGPKDLKGQRVPEGILWEDNNLWAAK
jgi:hypothetical protein